MSPAEHKANLVLSALALLSICALSLSSCRLLAAKPWPAHLAVVAVVFGTGLFHYATYDACFTHVYSAAGCSLAIFLGVRARTTDRPLSLVTTTTVAFFLLSLRSTNLITLVALLVGYLLWTDVHGPVAGGVAAKVRRALPACASVCLGAALAISVQLVYGIYASRALTLSGIGGADAFRFDRPMHLAVLVSYERGLFTFYPVLVPVLVCAFAVPRTRRAALLFSGVIAMHAGIYGFWHSWYLGGGFGHRGFVDVVPLASVILAVALSEIQARSPWTLSGVLLVLCACTLVTLELMAGYWKGTLPFEGTSGPLYWWHLGALGPGRP